MRFQQPCLSSLSLSITHNLSNFLTAPAQVNGDVGDYATLPGKKQVRLNLTAAKVTAQLLENCHEMKSVTGGQVE